MLNGDDLPPLLHGHCPASSLLRGSPPLRRIVPFGLAVGAACPFSLGIAGQGRTKRSRPPLGAAMEGPRENLAGISPPASDVEHGRLHGGMLSKLFASA